MKILRCDQENAMMKYEMGAWMQRQGIDRRPKGKCNHAYLAEATIRIVKDTMRLLDEEARMHGIKISVRA